MKTFWNVVFQAIFWLWNLTFLAVVYFGILPYVAPPLDISGNIQTPTITI